jgi:hypothetical protein
MRTTVNGGWPGIGRVRVSEDQVYELDVAQAMDSLISCTAYLFTAAYAEMVNSGVLTLDQAASKVQFHSAMLSELGLSEPLIVQLLQREIGKLSPCLLRQGSAPRPRLELIHDRDRPASQDPSEIGRGGPEGALE